MGTWKAGLIAPSHEPAGDLGVECSDLSANVPNRLQVFAHFFPSCWWWLGGLKRCGLAGGSKSVGVGFGLRS